MKRFKLPLRRESKGWNCMETPASTPAGPHWGEESARDIETTLSGLRLGKEEAADLDSDGRRRGKESANRRPRKERARGTETPPPGHRLETTPDVRRGGKEIVRVRVNSPPCPALLFAMERVRQRRIESGWPAGVETDMCILEEAASGGIVVYYPMITELPANGKYRKMNPVFQGKTIEISAGSELADILGVRITARGRNEIYGTITARFTFLGGIMLFDRRVDNPQVVHDEDWLELTRPLRGMPGVGRVEIEAKIWVGSDERVDMTVSWQRTEEAAFDQVREVTGYGNGGSVLHVMYMVYEKAIAAFIEITFKPCYPVEICGCITAHNNMYSDLKSSLFTKEWSHGEHLRVEDGEQQLPLLKYVIPVPIYKTPNHDMMGLCYEDEIDVINSYDGCLQIDFNLRNSGDQGKIAKGDLEFPIKRYGECIGKIYSMYGVMQAKLLDWILGKGHFALMRRVS